MNSKIQFVDGFDATAAAPRAQKAPSGRDMAAEQIMNASGMRAAIKVARAACAACTLHNRAAADKARRRRHSPVFALFI